MLFQTRAKHRWQPPSSTFLILGVGLSILSNLPVKGAGDVEIIREGGGGRGRQTPIGGQSEPWGPLSSEERIQFTNRMQRLVGDYMEHPDKLASRLMGLANRGGSIDIRMIFAFLDTPAGDIQALEALGYVRNVQAKAEIINLLKARMGGANLVQSKVAEKSLARLQGVAASPAIQPIPLAPVPLDPL